MPSAATSPASGSDPRGRPPCDVIQSDYGCLVAKLLTSRCCVCLQFCDTNGSLDSRLLTGCLPRNTEAHASTCKDPSRRRCCLFAIRTRLNFMLTVSLARKPRRTKWQGLLTPSIPSIPSILSIRIPPDSPTCRRVRPLIFRVPPIRHALQRIGRSADCAALV
jgi:hypothetical protein